MEMIGRRVRAHPAVVLAAGAMLLSGGLLLHWLSRLTFWRDEWGFLLHRRGWSVGTFLDPAVEHLVAIPILIYKLLLETAGMDSPVPFQVVAVLGFLTSVALLFIYVRSRVGEWLALQPSSRSSSWGPHGTTCSSRTKSGSSARWRAASRRCCASTGAAAGVTSPQRCCWSPAFSSRMPGFRSWPRRPLT
jgi:hypothetical protein